MVWLMKQWTLWNKETSIYSKLLLIVISGFCGGVVLGFLLEIDHIFLFSVLIISVVGPIFYKKLTLISLCLISFVLGVVRTDFIPSRDIPQKFLGEEVVIQGFIFDEPIKRENSLQVVLKPDGFESKISITTERSDFLKYGQRIIVRGRLSMPENFITENDIEFDYINYLSKDRIHYLMVFPNIEIRDGNGGWFYKKLLFDFKNLLVKKIERTISSPESEYLKGLLFGIKHAIPKDLNDKFREVGLSHVVVLSGYNITIIADSVIKMFSFLSQGFNLSLGIFSIILFAVMTGASSTIIRASIMALIVILGKYLGRTYSTSRALFLAGFLMVLHNPNIILYDPSFQLSFLATFGLIYLSPLISEKLYFITNRLNLKELVASTLATQIFVLPFILSQMGNISLIAPLSNIFVLPLVPISMFFGFLTSLTGIVSETLALVPGVISYGLLHFQILVVELFSKLPFSSINIKNFPLWASLIIYLFYLFYLKENFLTKSSSVKN
jgi:competence protein ComEC